MNKNDFLTLLIMNIVSLALLIEHWCGLELAISYFCGWMIVSMITHIYILRDYIVKAAFVKEDYTR